MGRVFQNARRGDGSNPVGLFQPSEHRSDFRHTAEPQHQHRGKLHVMWALLQPQRPALHLQCGWYSMCLACGGLLKLSTVWLDKIQLEFNYKVLQKLQNTSHKYPSSISLFLDSLLYHQLCFHPAAALTYIHLCVWFPVWNVILFWDARIPVLGIGTNTRVKSYTRTRKIWA